MNGIHLALVVAFGRLIGAVLFAAAVDYFAVPDMSDKEMRKT